MDKICLLLLISGLSVGPVFARQSGPPDPATLKARQRQELQALKLKEKYVKGSLEHSDLPKAVRMQMKHELKREKRKLLQRQKDERQTLKDRNRLLKLEMEQLQGD